MINAATKALCAALIACILGIGYEAVTMTHVFFTYTVTFGENPTPEHDEITLAAINTLGETVNPDQLHPQHKPKVK